MTENNDDRRHTWTREEIRRAFKERRFADIEAARRAGELDDVMTDGEVA